MFVDDDPAIRELWSAILMRENFEVTTASTVARALSLITEKTFDVLIADLNIGEPADGFTVVSAMRRVQPDAVTMILTGYPAFQAALRAIHEQVDDFLTKPAEPAHLVKSVRDNMTRRKKHAPVQAERLAQIIARHRDEIIENWCAAVERNPEVKAIPLTREERINHLPDVLDELVRRQPSDQTIETQASTSAARHGIIRRQQGYTPSMLLEETRILHHVLADCVEKNLLQVDISNLLPDIAEVDDRVHRMLKYSLEAFLQLRNDSCAAPIKKTA